MLNNDFIDSLSRQLSGLLPMAEGIRQDARTKIEHQLRKSFAQLDLMTRSDFDAQSRSLQRAQEQVAELELLLADMEARLAALESVAVKSDSPD